jgi:hypothetical protein
MKTSNQTGSVKIVLIVIIILAFLIVGYFVFSKKTATVDQQVRAPVDISTAAPKSTSALVVLSPNGGESYKVASRQIITWSAPSAIKTVRIFLESVATHYVDGGVGGEIPVVHKILAQDAINNGSYAATIPEVAAGKYNVLIEAIDNSGEPVVLSDTGDDSFSITSQ